MKIDFNELETITMPGMNDGTGMMTVRMYNDDNYIISGFGKAVCDDSEEELGPSMMHICPKGSRHSISNTGDEDLVMLTIVVKG